MAEKNIHHRRISGVAEMNVQHLVGIPYQPWGRSPRATDCWGLCMMFYECVLGIVLPDMLDPEYVWGDWEFKLDEPVDYCLVKSRNSGGIADHYAVYFNGYVLSAENPHSVLVPLKEYLKRRPNSEYVAYRVHDEAKAS